MARGLPHRAVAIAVAVSLPRSPLSPLAAFLFHSSATTPNGRFRVLERETLALEN